MNSPSNDILEFHLCYAPPGKHGFEATKHVSTPCPLQGAGMDQGDKPILDCYCQTIIFEIGLTACRGLGCTRFIKQIGGDISDVQKPTIHLCMGGENGE